MFQSDFGEPSALGAEGSIYNSAPYVADTKVPTVPIEFGRRLSYDDLTRKAVSPVGINKIVITSSGALDASDTFSLSLKITNTATGVETVNALTTGVYGTSDAVTMGVLLTAAKALTGISSSSSYASQVLTLLASTGYVIEVLASSIVYGGGSTQTLVSKVNSDTRIRAGYAKHNNFAPFMDAGVLVSRYTTNDPVTEVQEGQIVVQSSTGFTGGDSLYLIGYGTNRGRIANSAGDDTITVPVTDTSHRKTASGSDSKGVVYFKLA